MELHLGAPPELQCAAEHCGVTQPALTKAIRKLEEELDGELIFRERNLSHLTDLGRHVLPWLERCAAVAEKDEAVAAKVRRQMISSVRVALSTWVPATLIAEPLRETAARFEGLEVELFECECQEQLLDALLAGKADVGIGARALGGVSDCIDRWLMFEEDLVLLLNPSDPLAQREAVDREQLRGLHWLVRNGSG